MEVKDRILIAAQELFYTYGLKSITMDDVCKHLGISKKTLYQHFTDKEDIIHSLLEVSMEADCQEMDKLGDAAKDAVQELVLLMQHVSKLFSSINPNLFYDMQKYHPQAWKKFLEFKDNRMMTMVERNIGKGIAQGLYRKSIDMKLLARMRMEQVTLALDPRIFPADKFNLTRVQLQLLEHFLYGIATLKGHKLINKYLQITEEE